MLASPVMGALAGPRAALHKILDGRVGQGEEVCPPSSGHNDLGSTGPVHGSQEGHVALVWTAAHERSLGGILRNNLKL